MDDSDDTLAKDFDTVGGPESLKPGGFVSVVVIVSAVVQTASEISENHLLAVTKFAEIVPNLATRQWVLSPGDLPSFTQESDC